MDELAWGVFWIVVALVLLALGIWLGWIDWASLRAELYQASLTTL